MSCFTLEGETHVFSFDGADFREEKEMCESSVIVVHCVEMLRHTVSVASEGRKIGQILKEYTFFQVQGVWWLQRGLQPHPLLLFLAD